MGDIITFFGSANALATFKNWVNFLKSSGHPACKHQTSSKGLLGPLYLIWSIRLSQKKFFYLDTGDQIDFLRNLRRNPISQSVTFSPILKGLSKTNALAYLVQKCFICKALLCLISYSTMGLYHKTDYGRNLRISLLRYLSLASLFSLVWCLRVWLGAYPRVEHLKGSLLGQTPALPANTRLG